MSAESRPESAPERSIAWVGNLHRRLVYPRRIAVLAERLAVLLPPDCQLLDVGCGDGTLGALLQKSVRGLRVAGVEVLPRKGCAIECHLFDGIHLPFADGSFDGCLFVDVLHHTLDPFAVLQDACRVSREFILIKDHLAEDRWDDWRLRFMDWVGNRSHGVALPYTFLSGENWRDLFDRLRLEETRREDDLPLYPLPASLVFGRGLHFAAFLRKGLPNGERTRSFAAQRRAVPSTLMDAPKTESELFDQHVDRYDEELAAAISASGENRGFFAEGRVTWLHRCLAQAGDSARSVLDFGCGDGSTAPLLLRILNAESVLGVDVSERSVAIAKQRCGSDRITFGPLGEFRPQGGMDLVYCNGVFHHIPPAERAGALVTVNNALETGGLFAFWENSPWNPVMRYSMSRCAFDRDAILMTPSQARSLLRSAGFEILRTDFRFVFPHALRAFRPLENVVYRMPLGAQYQILCRKVR